ncbi:MAG: hypothetical protein U9O78_04790 [Patescibacteria group bacterium]|nr:hypothetical protein [Patescibacteria group bacterium]
MNTIKECFEIILEGNKNKSRQAARQVRKLLYASRTKDKYNDIKKLVKGASREYDKISEDWRQENFVMAISVIYFLHDREVDPDFLFPWLFQLLLHSNGCIRYAAVRMLSHELRSLTVYIRVPDFKSGMTNLKPKQADAIIFSLFVHLNKLLKKTWKPKYIKYKYISSLPTGLYKSIQMVIAKIEELCGQEYMSDLVKKYNEKDDDKYTQDGGKKMKKKKAVKIDKVYTFKITLDPKQRREKPWREIAIIGRESLYRLAKAIVNSFNFYFDHCFGFYDNLKSIYDSKDFYELFTDIPTVEHTPEAKSVEQTKISQAFNPKNQKMLFFFDYGDSWHFTVELINIKPAKTGRFYPMTKKSHGKAPEQYPPCDD